MQFFFFFIELFLAHEFSFKNCAIQTRSPYFCFSFFLLSMCFNLSLANQAICIHLQTIHWCKSEEGRTSSNMSSIVADLNSTRILFLFYCDESINIIYCTTSLTKKKHNLLNKVLTSQETRGEDSQCGTGFGQPIMNQSTTRALNEPNPFTRFFTVVVGRGPYGDNKLALHSHSCYELQGWVYGSVRFV